MKKYIELSIKGTNEDVYSFVERLKNYTSDAFKFSEIREDNMLRDGYYLEFVAKRSIDFRARIILIWDEGGLRICNVVPRTVSFLEVEQYNFVVRHFYEDVIEHTRSQALQINITKEDNSIKDLISAPAYRALILWEELCNKNSPIAHPNDYQRWLDFICELYINDDHLSLSDFRNWLIDDMGWYYDTNDDDTTINDLEINLEFGLELLSHYAEKTKIR